MKIERRNGNWKYLIKVTGQAIMCMQLFRLLFVISVCNINRFEMQAHARVPTPFVQQMHTNAYRAEW